MTIPRSHRRRPAPWVLEKRPPPQTPPPSEPDPI
jgi:hypothetical protein